MDFLVIALIFFAVVCWPTEKRRAAKRAREAARLADRMTPRVDKHPQEAWVDEIELLDPETHTLQEINTWLVELNSWHLTNRYLIYLLKSKGLRLFHPPLKEYYEWANRIERFQFEEQILIDDD